MTTKEANIVVEKFLNEPDTKILIELVKKEHNLKEVGKYIEIDGELQYLFHQDIAEYFALYLNPIEGIDFIEELRKKINELRNDG